MTMRERGFTLVEVLVALAVIAIALPALMLGIMSNLDGTGYMREKVIAQWVASNRLSELRAVNFATGKVPTSKPKGKEEMAGREWYWSVRTKQFPQKELKDMYGVEVTVRKSEDQKESPIVTMFGVLQQFDPRAAAALKQLVPKG
jgi:general secretion pathway protein I